MKSSKLSRGSSNVFFDEADHTEAPRKRTFRYNHSQDELIDIVNILIIFVIYIWYICLSICLSFWLFKAIWFRSIAINNRNNIEDFFSSLNSNSINRHYSRIISNRGSIKANDLGAMPWTILNGVSLYPCPISCYCCSYETIWQEIWDINFFNLKKWRNVI